MLSRPGLARRLTSTAAFSSSCSVRRRVSPSSADALPPSPKKLPRTLTAHGTSWVDPYHWMSDRRDPDLALHLRLENSYADAFMADTLALRGRLLGEMTSMLPPSVSTPPERWGPWLYYEYIPQGKEYPVLCRKWGGRHAGFARSLLDLIKWPRKEQVLLDWNEIAQRHGFVHIGSCKISPDHKYLAYTLDTSGSEIFVLQVKDLATGCALRASEVEGVVNVAWAKNSGHLLYTVSDETLRPFRVCRKNIFSDMDDCVLFEEKDPGCCIDIANTKDGNFITINSNSRSSSEEGCFSKFSFVSAVLSSLDIYPNYLVYVMDSEKSDERDLSLIRKRNSGVQYFLEHHKGYFYILTNACERTVPDAGKYYIARCRVENSELDKWEAIVIPGPGATFQDMDIFSGHLVLSLQKEGLPMLCSISMPLANCTKGPFEIDDLDPWFFPMPSSICSVSPSSNHDFMATSYRVVISSLLMPDIIVDYDMAEKKHMVVHQEVLQQKNASINSYNDPSHNDTSEYGPGHLASTGTVVDNFKDMSGKFICERKEVTSHDGVLVPLTIVYSRKAGRMHQSPTLLHGYGAYGEVLDKSWCPEHVCLLDRGWTLAFADVRGGGGGGHSWHQAGTQLHKLNSVYDFVACAEYLISEGYVHRSKLCAIGFSAGGLLVGATINMYPRLFSAVILKVPFLDICNTLLDPTLPLTMMDYEEFGDPRVECHFKMLHAYSPYDNISPESCPPPMLVTAAFNDSRVGVWEAAKWVARLRDNSCLSCSKSIILKTNMDAGHFSEGGRYQHCEESAFDYAFLIKAIGMLDNERT